MHTIETAREVLEQVELFAQAFLDADVDALEPLLTEKYIHINGSSGIVLSKGQWLEYIKTRRAELDAGQLVIDEYLNSEIEVVVYDDAAMVTGVNTSKGQRNGVPSALKLRFTNLWVREHGCWRRAAFHDSAIPAV